MQVFCYKINLLIRNINKTEPGKSVYEPGKNRIKKA